MWMTNWNFYYFQWEVIFICVYFVFWDYKKLNFGCLFSNFVNQVEDNDSLTAQRPWSINISILPNLYQVCKFIFIILTVQLYCKK